MRIDLAGYGPGAAEFTTQQVHQALAEAELIITSRRLAGILCPEKRVVVETDSRSICRILEESDCSRILCLFGGDSSFYSGAAPLMKRIAESEILQDKHAEVRLLPGISSLSAACARLGISFREMNVYSAHGRECNVVRAVMNGKKSFFLTGGNRSPEDLCARLAEAGLESLSVTVLENLSCPDESVRTMTAGEAAKRSFSPLSVLAVDPAPVSAELQKGASGIRDDAFVRGNVPMTKRFVRSGVLSLLTPGTEETCWDLGAGTGSVSVELAAHCGRVISVERNPEAVALMEENRRRFGAWNMEIVQGELPGVLDSLPAPDKIFLGGGGRWIREILQKTESRPVICASAVTLETLQEVTCALEETGYETQVVQIAVTDVKKRGGYHMLDARNPVFLILGTRQ